MPRTSVDADISHFWISLPTSIEEKNKKIPKIGKNDMFDIYWLIMCRAWVWAVVQAVNKVFFDFEMKF